MPWTTPKTDWDSTQQGVTDTDFNRIEENTEYLYDNVLQRVPEAFGFVITSNGQYNVGDVAPAEYIVHVAAKWEQARRLAYGTITLPAEAYSVEIANIGIKAGDYGVVSGGGVHIYLCDGNGAILEPLAMKYTCLTVPLEAEYITPGYYRIFPGVLTPYYNNEDVPNTRADHFVLYGHFSGDDNYPFDGNLLYTASSDIVKIRRFAFEFLRGAFF